MSGPLERLRATLAYKDPDDHDDEVTFMRRRVNALEAAARDLVTALDGELALEPCHVVGMHQAGHTATGVCQEQRADVLARLLLAMGVEEPELGRRLHEESCWQCHDPTSEERYRELRRELHRWAGVEIPPAMAELAPDAPRPDDAFWTLAYIVACVPHHEDGWRSQGPLNSHHAHPDQVPLPLRGNRFGVAIGQLEEAGLLETTGNPRKLRPTELVDDPNRGKVQPR